MCHPSLLAREAPNVLARSKPPLKERKPKINLKPPMCGVSHLREATPQLLGQRRRAPGRVVNEHADALRRRGADFVAKDPLPHGEGGAADPRHPRSDIDVPRIIELGA